MMNCITKKQKVSNIAEKNDTESVFMKKKISKKCSPFATDDELKN